MRRVLSATCVLVFLFGEATCVRAEDSVYSRTENVVYSVRDGVGLILDIFQPKQGTNGLGIVNVMSGAWYSEEAQLRAHFRAKVFEAYCSRGFTVFMIRPGSRTLFTGEEMVKNMKTGIRWVKAHSAEYKVDPARLGIMGASAGGHLALMCLVTAEEGNPAAENQLERPDTKLAAAGIFFPPTDLLDWGGEKDGYRKLPDLYFKCGIEGVPEDQVLAKVESLSPARLIKFPPPPMLLIHGDSDTVVPLSQSEKLVEAVRKVGGEVELIVKPGGAHPWPTLNEEVEVMAEWFLKTLVSSGSR
ncbi:MAG: prolyl oligopeptidase family serine peptidase [Candidatus Omnitrophica bacterium]|nr:hypothetical protein [bacterium]NUN97541.1 prolyl oligopeptidase family serine peptidase [Candidatus Omnitrophota bacterium]